MASPNHSQKNGSSPTSASAEGAISHTNNHHIADSGLLPQLESIERMMKLPVVEAAWHQSQDVYGKVKGYNAVFNWAFRTAEDAVQIAVTTAAPLVQKLDRPIQYVDQTLCTGIDKLEAKAPIIKEQPAEIYNQARNRVVDIVQPQIQKVCSLKSVGQQRAASLKELSWQKANEVLATQYGSMAVTGVDTTSALAERLLDYYFPNTEEDEEGDNVSVAADVDPVLHTCQTVGRLSNKVARRVYRTVSRQIKVLKKEDVHEYVASLIAVLRLTQYLNFINEKVQSTSAITCGTSGSSNSAPSTSSPIPTASSTPSPSNNEKKKHQHNNHHNHHE